MMQVTERNLRVAKQVAQVMENEKCTVDEVREILFYVVSVSGKQSIAQLSEAVIEHMAETVKRCMR